MQVDQRQSPSLFSMPDGATLFREYENSIRRILALAASGTDPQLPIPSCPAWNARDLVAHLIGTAAHIASGDPLPEDIPGWIAREVRVRADRSWQELRDEWETLVPVVSHNLGGQAGKEMVIDAVTHEQDLRAAIGPQASDHLAGLTALVPCIVSYVRDLEPFGTGPGARLRTPASDVTVGGPRIGVEAEVADEWELSRLLACRRSASQLEALPHRGDTTLLYTLVSRYPLPEHPLDV
ncbi:MAG TPA: maleylpyruvate isomerase family mycothiol-dependent enzyme [Amycolatopsis sp.]|nr:maleylpyruvate isomerase family mycothiol-dependent enzyme [Amycolatopsis sp.]